MSLPPDQRRQLAAFIRARRAALSPAALASPEYAGRRRTPGLRREEVAQLCGLSTTWYTWLEQGRDIALSATALARLSDALRLSSPERAYLFELTQRRDPAPPTTSSTRDAVPSELTAALHSTGAPSYLLDRLWCARAWNAAAAHLFSGWLEGGEPNLLRFVFLDPGATAFIHDWENRARRLVAEFRADTAHKPDDPAMKGLVGELQRASPAFARLWADHVVLAREGGTRLFNHPEDGLRSYKQLTLVPATYPDFKLVMLLSGPGTGA